MFPVVDAAGDLVGVLSFAALRALLETTPRPGLLARDLCDPNLPTLRPNTGLDEAFRVMEAEGLEDLPVVDADHPRRVLGVLSRGDLIAAYNRTMATLSAPGLPAWLSAAEPQWSDRYRVLVVDVPRGWIGRSLRQIDCRARYGVAVLAVHPGGQEPERGYELPDPMRPLAAGDRLVLAGTAEALRTAQTG
jgi:hypothetical protein